MGTADASGGPWELVRLQGVTTRKEKALYFLSILPGRERKLPKPRLQYLFGKQGIWFELAEGTPPPHAPPPPPPAASHAQPRLRLGTFPGSLPSLGPPTPAPGYRPPLPTGFGNRLQQHSPEGSRREGSTTGRGQFCTLGWGSSKERAEPESADRSSTAPSRRLNH